MFYINSKELRRIEWYIKAIAKGVNYAVDDRIDRVLKEKKFLEAAGWGKTRLTFFGKSVYEKLSPSDIYLIKHNHLPHANMAVNLAANVTTKSYLKQQDITLAGQHAPSDSSGADLMQAG